MHTTHTFTYKLTHTHTHPTPHTLWETCCVALARAHLSTTLFVLLGLGPVYIEQAHAHTSARVPPTRADHT